MMKQRKGRNYNLQLVLDMLNNRLENFRNHMKDAGLLGRKTFDDSDDLMRLTVMLATDGNPVVLAETVLRSLVKVGAIMPDDFHGLDKQCYLRGIRLVIKRGGGEIPAVGIDRSDIEKERFAKEMEMRRTLPRK